MSESQQNGASADGANGTSAKARPICGAKTRAGGVCRGIPCKNGRCRMHGGMTPNGVNSPHYRHGLRSKYLKHLPKAMCKSFKSAVTDPELLSLREDVALLQTRIMTLLEQLGQTEVPPWGSVVDALVTYEQDPTDANLAALAQTIRTGADAAAEQEALWEKLQDALAQKSKVTSIEVRRQLDVGALVGVDTALATMRMTIEIAKQCIPDREMLAQFMYRVSAMLPSPDRIELETQIEYDDE